MLSIDTLYVIYVTRLVFFVVTLCCYILDVEQKEN